MGNRTHSNLGPGLVFAARHNTVRGNIADRNLDVGIGVFQDHAGDSTGNVITHNVANANHAHGIRVVARTVDGGGNVAHRNTPLPNCVRITCG